MSHPDRQNRFADIRRKSSTESTNSDVLALGRDGGGEGIVVVADVQTAGRGRHGRSWVAPPATGLLCSVLLRPPGRVVELTTAMVAVAALDTVRGLGVGGAGIKWPNDLVVDPVGGPSPGGSVRRERKLAGILAEVDWTTGSTAAGGHRPVRGDERVLVAAGMGMNVTIVDRLPHEVAERRIALHELLDDPVELDQVLHDYLGALERRYRQLLDDRAAILDAWRAALLTLGREVRVDLGPGELCGTATDVDTSGRLVVVTADGDRRVVAAGDVIHLDAAAEPGRQKRSRHSDSSESTLPQ